MLADCGNYPIIVHEWWTSDRLLYFVGSLLITVKRSEESRAFPLAPSLALFMEISTLGATLRAKPGPFHGNFRQWGRLTFVEETQGAWKWLRTGALLVGLGISPKVGRPRNGNFPF